MKNPSENNQKSNNFNIKTLPFYQEIKHSLKHRIKYVKKVKNACFHIKIYQIIKHNEISK